MNKPWKNVQDKIDGSREHPVNTLVHPGLLVLLDHQVDHHLSFGGSFPIDVANLPHDPLMPELEDTTLLSEIQKADFNNMESSTVVSPIPITRVYPIHPKAQIIGDPKLAIQTRGMTKKNSGEHAMISYIQKQRRINHKDFTEQLLFSYFFSTHEPTKNLKALDDKDSNHVYFWPLTFIYDFPVTKMDVKSAFLYGTIEEEVYVCQPPDNAQQVSDEFNGKLTFFLGLQVKQKEDGIFISQDKYIGEILKKFGFSSLKTASTPMETNKALTKDEDGEDVDVHLYRSMIGSLMYLTSSRPDIMFSVCACSRFQVQPKVSHLNAVKRIFRYLKGQPKLGLWYPKDSPLILEAFSDSDYAGASLDRKSTTGGCQFLGSRLISWQCKKQTVVANSTTEAEYIAASHCCGQVLWIQNQMLDYGFNFMQTKIHVDNESAICVIKNPVYHSKTKHIEIRHHFIRDSYEKRLIEMVKIHTDHNVADLLTKAFDVSRFNFLVASIGKRGRDTKIPQSGGPPIKVGDEAVHKELGDRMERAATTASSFEAEQDSGSGPRCQETTLGM
ncbi:hypothetical protein Tco_1301455 [Tanacetum coccineum]